MKISKILAKIISQIYTKRRVWWFLLVVLQWFLKMAGSAKVEEDELVEKMGGGGFRDGYEIGQNIISEFKLG